MRATFLDLVRAPLGAHVTEYAQRPDDGSIVELRTFTHDGTDPRVTTIDGRIREATPATLAEVIASAVPGDVVYLRAGTYRGKYDSEGWNEANIVLARAGTSDQPLQFVAYPGETVTIHNAAGRPNWCLGMEGRSPAHHVTIAGIDHVAPHDCVFGGGYTPDSSKPEAGAQGVRLVGNTFTITDAAANTMTGMVSVQGDSWQVIGNRFRDPHDRAIHSNNHAIYVQSGADDVVIARNDLCNLRMGHVIQVHQDGTAQLYRGILIEGNWIQPRSVDECRGITVSNADAASTVTIRGNTLVGLGQGFSAISVYRGLVSVEDNDVIDCNAGLVLNGQLGGTRRVVARNNLLRLTTGVPKYGFENGAAATELTVESERE
jgi:hypothetical protein